MVSVELDGDEPLNQPFGPADPAPAPRRATHVIADPANAVGEDSYVEIGTVG